MLKTSARLTRSKKTAKLYGADYSVIIAGNIKKKTKDYPLDRVEHEEDKEDASNAGQCKEDDKAAHGASFLRANFDAK